MKWMIILYVVTAGSSTPVEWNKVITASSKEECLSIAASDAKKILSERPDLMAIGFACREDEPKPPPEESRDI